MGSQTLTPAMLASINHDSDPSTSTSDSLHHRHVSQTEIETSLSQHIADGIPRKHVGVNDLRAMLEMRDAIDGSDAHARVASLEATVERLNHELAEMRRALEKSRQESSTGSGGVLTAGGNAVGVAQAAEALDEKMKKEEQEAPQPPPMMVSDAPIAPPIDAPNAPPMDAPPLAPGLHNEKTSKSKYKASVKMKPFHWTKVDPHEIFDLGPDSCWLEINSIPVSLETTELESWFAAKPPKVKVGKEKEEKQEKKIRTAKEEVNLVDPKRAYHIDIVLSRMRVTYASIRDAILYMDDAMLHPEKLQSLIQCCPTPEEIDTIKAYLKTDGGDPLLLNKTGKFFYTLSSIKPVRNVPSLQVRLELFLFKQLFPSMVDSIETDLKTIEQAMNECKSSTGLKEVLAVILHIGNFINSGSRIGDARGFKLSTLNQLRETKSSVNPSSSLLDYLVQFIEARLPHLKQFPNELMHVKKAAMIESQAMMNEIQSIGKKLDRLTTALQVPNISAKQQQIEKQEQEKIEKNLRAIKKQHEKKRLKELAKSQEKLAKIAKKKSGSHKKSKTGSHKKDGDSGKKEKTGFIASLFGRGKKKDKSTASSGLEPPETSLSRSHSRGAESISLNESPHTPREESKSVSQRESDEPDVDLDQPLPASAVPTHNSSWEDIEPSAYDPSQDRFEPIMLKFVTIAKTRYQSLIQRYETIQKQLHELYRFFGEGTETMSSQEFFTKFDSFLTSFTATCVKSERIRAQAAKDEQRKKNETEMRTKFKKRTAPDSKDGKHDPLIDGRRALKSTHGGNTSHNINTSHGITTTGLNVRLARSASGPIHIPNPTNTNPTPAFQSVKLRPPPPPQAPIPSTTESNMIADAAKKLKPATSPAPAPAPTGTRSSFVFPASATTVVTPLSPGQPPRAVGSGSSSPAPIKRLSQFSLAGASVTGAAPVPSSENIPRVRPPTPSASPTAASAASAAAQIGNSPSPLSVAPPVSPRSSPTAATATATATATPSPTMSGEPPKNEPRQRPIPPPSPSAAPTPTAAAESPSPRAQITNAAPLATTLAAPRPRPQPQPVPSDFL